MTRIPRLHEARKTFCPKAGCTNFVKEPFWSGTGAAPVLAQPAKYYVPATLCARSAFRMLETPGKFQLPGYSPSVPSGMMQVFHFSEEIFKSEEDTGGFPSTWYAAK
eukprot:460519-Pelagomonas_calceolata.AAC.2